MQQRPAEDVRKLKQRLIVELHRLQQTVIDEDVTTGE